MKLDIISYDVLLNSDQYPNEMALLQSALLQKGIVGIRGVPQFEQVSQNYIQAVRAFSALPEEIKQRYAPNRDAGETEGYELGAEWFKDEKGEWQIDDKKASYYAYVPEHIKNRWPQEVDLKTPYLELGQLIYKTGLVVMKAIGLDETVGLPPDQWVGYGRMLHYQKVGHATDANPNWCGAHLDHGVFTGLVPAYYFRDGELIDEPEDAGLYIVPSAGGEFEKINANDKSILLFQVGEFGQLASHDHIKATRHIVKKTKGSIERFTFALFYSMKPEVVIQSKSQLINDERFAKNQTADGRINYGDWEKASYERYRAR